VLITGLLGGGTWYWLEADARARRSEAEREVLAAMSDAREHRSRARALGEDGLVAWTEARAAAAQAETILDTTALEDDVARSVAELAAAIAREEQEAVDAIERAAEDAILLDQLAEIPIPPDLDDQMLDFEKRDARRRAREYSRAFERFGLSLAKDSQAAWIERIRAAADPAAIAAGVDDWALASNVLGEPDTREQLHAIAREADPDELRNKLRSLWRKEGNSLAELRNLEANRPVETLPPRSPKPTATPRKTQISGDRSKGKANRLLPGHPPIGHRCIMLPLEGNHDARSTTRPDVSP